MKRRQVAVLESVFSRAALGVALAALAIVSELAAWSYAPPTPFLLVYPAVVIAAWWGGRAAGVAAVITSAVALAYSFLPPSDSLAIAARRDALDLALFLGASLLLTELIGRVKRALAEARAARRDAEAALEARDTVLAVVAHDLRNPLQTIGLNAELLAAEVSGAGAGTERHMKRIRDAAGRARRLVDGILDSARIGPEPFPIEKSTLSLASLVDESLSTFLMVARARAIDLEVPSSETLGGSITCDGERIAQVLSIIVGNALHYTPSGGKVTVAVRRRPEDVTFEVTDTGSGMAPNELARAFDRRWHGGHAGHGFGLGLWIARALVEAHGGRIHAESEPGKGTRMTFTVPQPAADEVAPAEGDLTRTWVTRAI